MLRSFVREMHGIRGHNHREMHLAMWLRRRRRIDLDGMVLLRAHCCTDFQGWRRGAGGALRVRFVRLLFAIRCVISSLFLNTIVVSLAEARDA